MSAGDTGAAAVVAGGTVAPGAPHTWSMHELHLLNSFLGSELDGFDETQHGNAGAPAPGVGIGGGFSATRPYDAMPHAGLLLSANTAPAEADQSTLGADSSLLFASGLELQAADAHVGGGLCGQLLGLPAASALVERAADAALLPAASQPSAGRLAPDGSRKRSSRFRGVTKHRRSGRYEAHVWVKETGKQVYLGGYALEEHAAEAFDVACIKVKGAKAKINNPIAKYKDLLPFLESVSIEELVMAVRRQSQGFARGSSAYRGVTHHPNGRYEARLGIPGSRHVYLGLFAEEEEAARAYDRALVRLRGPGAATNFSIGDYVDELRVFEAEREQAVQQPAAAPPLGDDQLPLLAWPFQDDLDMPAA